VATTTGEGDAVQFIRGQHGEIKRPVSKVEPGTV
jgi:hypothetical protein